jgi:hypothetical protein
MGHRRPGEVECHQTHTCVCVRARARAAFMPLTTLSAHPTPHRAHTNEYPTGSGGDLHGRRDLQVAFIDVYPFPERRRGGAKACGLSCPLRRFAGIRGSAQHAESTTWIFISSGQQGVHSVEVRSLGSNGALGGTRGGGRAGVGGVEREEGVSAYGENRESGRVLCCCSTAWARVYVVTH